MLTDIRILELLASKICHDLVSPVGAINNGVELIEDIGGDVVDEAMKLIGTSAAQASWRLKLFRLVYGRAGSESNLTFKDVQETIAAHFSGSKIKLHFGADFPHPDFVATRGALKCLLNLLLLAEESLVYGGDIQCNHGVGPYALGASLVVAGRNAGLSPAALLALDGTAPVEEITSRTVHAHVAGKFMAMHGFRYAVETPQSEQLMLHFVKE